MWRFLVGLAVVDAAIVVGLAYGVPHQTAVASGAQPPEKITESAALDGGLSVSPLSVPSPPLWKGVDTADLAKRVGDLYLGVRRRIGRNKKLVLLPPKRIGDDVEIRVSLARTSTFPASLYCFHCKEERCLYPEPTLTALEALAGAFDPEAVHALAAKVGKDHLLLTFVGGASAGPVVPKSDAQVCEADEARISVRIPPDYDLYDLGSCGARRCELAGSGEMIDITSGPIDDNKKLACLRAMCTAAAAAALGDVPAKIVGDQAFDQGGAFRGAEVALTLRGVAAPENREAFLHFWAGLAQALGDGK